jgi:hypothetical protein
LKPEEEARKKIDALLETVYLLLEVRQVLSPRANDFFKLLDSGGLSFQSYR